MAGRSEISAAIAFRVIKAFDASLYAPSWLDQISAERRAPGESSSVQIGARPPSEA